MIGGEADAQGVTQFHEAGGEGFRGGVHEALLLVAVQRHRPDSAVPVGAQSLGLRTLRARRCHPPGSARPSVLLRITPIGVLIEPEGEEWLNAARYGRPVAVGGRVSGIRPARLHGGGQCTPPAFLASCRPEPASATTHLNSRAPGSALRPDPSGRADPGSGGFDQAPPSARVGRRPAGDDPRCHGDARRGRRK